MRACTAHPTVVYHPKVSVYFARALRYSMTGSELVSHMSSDPNSYKSGTTVGVLECVCNHRIDMTMNGTGGTKNLSVLTRATFR